VGQGDMVVDERNAIAQLKRGDIRGLDVLMRIYQVRALRAAFMVTRDLPLAEDLVQSAFVRAYERIEQFDATRPFGPWFLRSVVNSAATAVDRRRRFVPFDTPADAGDHGIGSNAAATAGPSPETLILQAETHEELWQALDRLPPAQRAAAVLRLYLELPEAETAAQLGVPLGTVKSRVNAARTRLRLVLGRPPDNIPPPDVLAMPPVVAETVHAGQEAQR
jgi:RNA polymerase sigma-70 factor, ECF subfamily